MNERERFEEWAWIWYVKTAKKHDFERIEKKELFCYEGGRYYREDTNNYWITWQARDEIAQQDENELIETLIRICKITIKLQKELPPNTKWWSLVNENVDLIDIIEKHTSKTWEELNESEPKRN